MHSKDRIRVAVFRPAKGDDLCMIKHLGLPYLNMKVASATYESPLPTGGEGSGGERGNSQSLLRAHRTIPACQLECALQGRETVMTFMIG
jgi:hypothetical protein